MHCEVAVLDAKEPERVVPSWTLEEQLSISKRIRGVDPIGDDLSSPCQYKKDSSIKTGSCCLGSLSVPCGSIPCGRLSQPAGERERSSERAAD